MGLFINFFAALLADFAASFLFDDVFEAAFGADFAFNRFVPADEIAFRVV